MVMYKYMASITDHKEWECMKDWWSCNYTYHDALLLNDFFPQRVNQFRVRFVEKSVCFLTVEYQRGKFINLLFTFK